MIIVSNPDIGADSYELTEAGEEQVKQVRPYCICIEYMLWVIMNLIAFRQKKSLNKIQSAKL